MCSGSGMRVELLTGAGIAVTDTATESESDGKVVAVVADSCILWTASGT